VKECLKKKFDKNDLRMKFAAELGLLVLKINHRHGYKHKDLYEKMVGLSWKKVALRGVQYWMEITAASLPRCLLRSTCTGSIQDPITPSGGHASEGRERGSVCEVMLGCTYVPATLTRVGLVWMGVREGGSGVGGSGV